MGINWVKSNLIFMHKTLQSLPTRPRWCMRARIIAPAQRTYYLYADEGLIAETVQAITLNADGSVTASSTPQITTQYGPRPDSEFTTGTLFVKTKNSNGQDTASPIVAYFHHDHLQTPLQATDKAGNVVWAASYNAFGKASITTPAATPANPTITVNLRLPGQYLDEETGLHYNWHRYYDGEIGRYLTEDPIGLRGGVNRYGYVGGNPLSSVDPSGLVDLNLFPTSESIRNSAKNVPLQTDVFKVGGHGNQTTVVGADGKPLSPKELADLIRGNKKYKDGMPVDLLSCNTGKGVSPYAQSLANELRAPVNAPNQYLWYYPDGRLVPMGMLPDDKMDTSSPGKMNTFKPTKRP
jgi:RHS repeat-associated protein